MRTFYMFKINPEYSKLSEKIPYNLYSTMMGMKLLESNDQEYIGRQYRALTDAIDEDLGTNLYQDMSLLDGYMLNGKVHIYNNYYSDEKSRLMISKTFIVLRTNVPNSTFFTFLTKIPNLFVIDFEYQDYFWLKQIGNLRLVKPYETIV